MKARVALELTPRDCDLDYWLTAVAQGTLRGIVHGHSPTARVPDYMKQPGPLRSAIMSEMAFRTISEEKATRAIAHIAANAPDIDTMEFYTTQMIDEARHSRVFRGHLLELRRPGKRALGYGRGNQRRRRPRRARTARGLGAADDPRSARFHRRRRHPHDHRRRRARSIRRALGAQVAPARSRRRGDRARREHRRDPPSSRSAVPWSANTCSIVPRKSSACSTSSCRAASSGRASRPLT